MTGLINIKKCFYYNHSYHVCKKLVSNDPERQTYYKKYEGNLNYDDIAFPVTIKQSNKIENNDNIRINVLGYKNISVSYL